ncbi:S1 family peptidase [Streptomyces sp. NPDC056987]|uniref:S1 family peptidase n=1 Tax=Streptomyces sp. NPDC056987 TaxID=3345988 RepID=UPI0036353DD9
MPRTPQTLRTTRTPRTKHARRTLRRVTRLAAVGGLLCGGLLVSNAVAGEPAGRGTGPGGAASVAEVGTGLVTKLGTARTAGTWIAADGRPVVAVTDEDAAAEVRREGARAEVMRYSMRDLTTATETLRAAPRVPGTAWAVDYASNRVVVQADRTVSADDWSRLTDVADGIGDSVEMERTTGEFRTKVNGAAPIFTNSDRCSVGFNVTDGQDNFILTAGHCGPTGTTWFQDTAGGTLVGSTVATTFPESDFSLVQYENPASFDGTSTVDIGDGQGVRIIGAADPVVGQQVFRSGSTTGLRSGQVTALNVTVNYREGTVSGLIQTTVCAEPGDSGGPLLAQGLALGVTSGGNGDCTVGGTTFFQPVSTAMAALGVQLAGVEAGGGNETATGSSDGTVDSAVPAPTGTGTGGGVPAGNGTGTGAGVGIGVGVGTGGVSSIVDYRTLVPGLFIIAVSLLGLTMAQRMWSEKASYRSQYSQSWG